MAPHVNRALIFLFGVHLLVTGAHAQNDNHHEAMSCGEPQSCSWKASSPQSEKAGTCSFDPEAQDPATPVAVDQQPNQTAERPSVEPLAPSGAAAEASAVSPEGSSELSTDRPASEILVPAAAAASLSVSDVSEASAPGPAAQGTSSSPSAASGPAAADTEPGHPVLHNVGAPPAESGAPADSTAVAAPSDPTPQTAPDLPALDQPSSPILDASGAGAPADPTTTAAAHASPLDTTSTPAPAPVTPEPPASTSQTPAPAPPQPDGLAELHSLLGQARQAVALLEAAVSRQEQRIATLSTPAAVSAAATRGPAAGGAASPADLSAALLRSLGMDPAGTSPASRYALREALAQVLRERDGQAAGGPPGGGVAGAGYGRTGGVAAGDAGGAWFGQHFSLRSATQTAAPPPPPPPPPPLPSASTQAILQPPPSPPAAITCAFPYELPHPNIAASGGGPLLYIAAGDAAGTLFLLSPVDGSVLAAVPTGTDSPVTACTAYYVRRLESTVVTGHANGQTRSFSVVVQEQQQQQDSQDAQQQQQAEGARGASPPPLSKQRNAAGGGIASVSVQHLGLRHVVEAMPPGALPWAAVEELITPVKGAAATAGATAEAGVAASSQAQGGGGAATAGFVADAGYTGPPAPIMHILPYRLGNKVAGRRHLVVLDRAGNLRLDRENGTTRFWAKTNRTQLAVHFVSTYVVMLSAFHTTIINTLQPRQPRAYACQHLNGSRLVAGSFDGHRPFRGYGINTRGELLSMVTPHEGGLTTCKAHRATPLPWLDPDLLATRHQAVSMTPMRGYLLLTHGSHRVVLNVTGTVRHGIATLASITDEQLAGVATTIAASAAPPAPPATSADAPPEAPASGSHASWAASGGLINGLLPPPPVVAVAPGNQLVIIAVPPQTPPPPQQQQQHRAPAAAAGIASGSGSESSAAPAAAAEASKPPAEPAAGDGATAEGGVGGEAGAGLGLAMAGAESPGGANAAQQPHWAGTGAGPGALLVVLDSKMPRSAAPGPGSKIWSQPVFLGAMLLVGLYQFWRLSSNRTQRRSMTSGPRGSRRSRAYGGYGGGGGGGGFGAGGGGYGDPGGYMYGEGRAPLQPRSALRRGKSDRPMGRVVSYEDDDY